MSNPSHDLFVLIPRLFRRLCLTAGWAEPEFEHNSDQLDIKTTKSYLIDNTPLLLVLLLSLVTIDGGQTMWVAEMYVRFLDPTADEREYFLNSWDFLAYHGKELYPVPVTKSWKISAAKDLESLLREYDRLAVRLGYRPLFE